MFDIGWSELVVIAVVAIVVIGPKDLPRALRTFGQWTGRMKKMARDFQSQFNEAIREAELEDVKKSVTDIARIDPMADLRKDLSKVDASIRTELNKPAPPSLPAAAPAPAIAKEAAPASVETLASAAPEPAMPGDAKP
jgi:sec-independent protein translocase protein TatB